MYPQQNRKEYICIYEQLSLLDCVSLLFNVHVLAFIMCMMKTDLTPPQQSWEQLLILLCVAIRGYRSAQTSNLSVTVRLSLKVPGGGWVFRLKFRT